MCVWRKRKEVIGRGGREFYSTGSNSNSAFLKIQENIFYKYDHIKTYDFFGLVSCEIFLLYLQKEHFV